MIMINTSFKFEKPKEQIENEINNLKRIWEESKNEDLEWNRKYKQYGTSKLITEPFGLIVTLEIYNEIRKNTLDLSGLKIGINPNKKSNADIYIVDEKEFKKKINSRNYRRIWITPKGKRHKGYWRKIKRK